MEHYWEPRCDAWAKDHNFAKVISDSGEISYHGEMNGGKIIFKTSALPDTPEEEERRYRRANETANRILRTVAGRKLKQTEDDPPP